MKASEYLAAARDEIAKGWTKGELEDDDDNVCAIGAINRVAKNNKIDTLDDFVALCMAGSGAAEALRMMIKEFGSGATYGYGTMAITTFNDTRGCRQDVLDWFDKAIIGLEERGE